MREGQTAVIITNGQRQGETILDVVNGKPIGTLITQSGLEEKAEQVYVMADKSMYNKLDTSHAYN